MPMIRTPLTWAIAAAGFLCLYGCISSSNGPSTADQNASDAAVNQANAELSGTVTDLSNISQFQYGKEDLTSLKNSNADFQHALQLNPGNEQAKVGAALTGVLLAAQSPGISNQINHTVDAGSPLNLELPKQAPLARLAVVRAVAAQDTIPEFHQIQDSVAAILLPALEDAIAKLTDVYNDPNFSMTLTIDSSARKLGHAEIAVLLAGFKTTHALSTLLLAYDYDIDDSGSYDYLRVLDSMGVDSLSQVSDFSTLPQSQKDAINTLTGLLKPGSPFLAVRPAWQAKLAGVDGEINDALAVLQNGLAAVEAQTDPDYLLHVCPGTGLGSDCIESGDLSQAVTGVDSVQKYMTQPYSVSVGDTTILVNFAAYFNVQDYKKLLPYYNFYDVGDWSADKPVIYFTDAAANETGNLKTVSDILNQADSLNTPAADVIAQLKPIIHWQDPTFQGFLPGGTEDKVWAIVLKEAEAGQGPLPKASVSGLMSENFALSLLGTK